MTTVKPLLLKQIILITLHSVNNALMVMLWSSCQVAWVTRSGKTELAEPIAVRPTSETGLNHISLVSYKHLCCI